MSPNLAPKLILHTTGGLPCTIDTIQEMCTFLWHHNRSDPAILLLDSGLLRYLIASIPYTISSPTFPIPTISRAVNLMTGTEMEVRTHINSLPFMAAGSFALLDAARQPLLLCMPLDVEETNGLHYQ